MDREILVSIIIPVYNAEKTLKRCIDSVLLQTYKSIEIILVDDGSNDSSSLMCEEYSLKNNNIFVLHKTNEGLMSAWIDGLKRSKGDYITFVDSDDWIDKILIEKFIESVVRNDTDMVCCNKNLVYKDFDILYKEYINPGFYAYDDIKRIIYPCLINNGYYLGRGISPHRCGKLIKRKILVDNLVYCNREIVFGEDLNIMFPVILDCERIEILDDMQGLYYYRQNTGSIVRRYKKRMFEQISMLHRELLFVNFCKKKYDFKQQLEEDFICLYIEYVKNEAKVPYLTKREIYQIYENAKVLESSIVKSAKQNLYIKKLDMLLLESICHKKFCFFFLYFFMYKFLKKFTRNADVEYLKRKYI